VKIRVDEVCQRVTQMYPYTHRVEIGDLVDYEKVMGWINENNIGACAMTQSQAIYLNQQNTEWLLMRWL
jgi:hypothetical protein